MVERIGYIREVKLGGRIGRIKLVDKVEKHGYKIKAKTKES